MYTIGSKDFAMNDPRLMLPSSLTVRISPRNLKSLFLTFQNYLIECGMLVFFTNSLVTVFPCRRQFLHANFQHHLLILYWSTIAEPCIRIYRRIFKESWIEERRSLYNSSLPCSSLISHHFLNLSLNNLRAHKLVDQA